jgi:hypothetical protein
VPSSPTASALPARAPLARKLHNRPCAACQARCPRPWCPSKHVHRLHGTRAPGSRARATASFLGKSVSSLGWSAVARRAYSQFSMRVTEPPTDPSSMQRPMSPRMPRAVRRRVLLMARANRRCLHGVSPIPPGLGGARRSRRRRRARRSRARTRRRPLCSPRLLRRRLRCPRRRIRHPGNRMPR